MRLILKNLTKAFGKTEVLGGISLDIRDQELFFLLGPSGCGKTTLLRIIAGFTPPDKGEVYFGDRLMNEVAPHHRNTGLVFQSYALWPHLTVHDNIAYGLEVRRVERREKEQRIAEALALVQMETYTERMPSQLSGGQQQRVALARALVIRPDVLLLDEPLSNLDARLRLELREEIHRIHSRTRITMVYVTHDQKEALSLADRVAVLREGRIEQVGEPRAIYCQPANRFVADFIGETNWLAAEVVGGTPGATLVRTALGIFHVVTGRPTPVGAPVWLGFRPEAIQIGSAEINALETTIRHISYLGEVEQYELQVNDAITLRAVEQNPREIRRAGARLAVHVRPQNLLILPREERETR